MTTIKRLIKSIPLVGPILYWILQASYRQATSWFHQVESFYSWRKLQKSGNIKLELGAGAKSGRNGWTTVDLNGVADISHDLRRGIPLKDGTVSEIYTSHMFEHIPYSQLIKFIAECRRALKPGGFLSVCVPNSRLYIQAYIDKKAPNELNSFYRPAIVETNSFLDQVNYIAYMDGQHAYLFDEENLVNTLRKAGFSNVKLREYDPSLDIFARDFESIYAIAKK